MFKQFFRVEESQKFNLQDIKFYEMLGEGAFGKVWLAKRPVKVADCAIVTKGGSSTTISSVLDQPQDTLMEDEEREYE